jgi:hypothetical protein
MSYCITVLHAVKALGTSLKLIFENHDSVSVATLLHPAWHILKDLLRHKKIKSSLDSMAEIQLQKPENSNLTEKNIWDILNNDWKFIKHADKDHNEILDFDDDYLEGVTMFAITDFSEVSTQSSRMDLYQLWFIAKNPDIFNSTNGEGINVYERAILIYPDLHDLHAKEISEQKQIGLSILENKNQK